MGTVYNKVLASPLPGHKKAEVIVQFFRCPGARSFIPADGEALLIQLARPLTKEQIEKQIAFRLSAAEVKALD